MKTLSVKTRVSLQLVSILIFTLIATRAHTQGFYVEAAGGYGLCAAPSLDVSETNTDGNSTEYKYVKGSGSLGKGFQVGGNIGYMFNNYIGAELGIMYLVGDKLNLHSNYSSSNEENTIQAKILRFIPAVKFTTGQHKMNPYMKAGIIIGTAAKIVSTMKGSYTNMSFPHTYDEEVETSGNISFGFAGSLGADYALADHIGIFAEINVMTHSWAPKKSVITRNIQNGTDQLPTMSTNQKETVYVDSYTYDGTIDPDSPDKETTIHVPLSSVGLNVGVRFNIGGKKE